VIHAAAIANIDFCQQHKKMAEAVNVDVTGRIAGLCSEAGIKMILCSTDAVFDGSRGDYREGDQRTPINYYAETKIRAEDIVLKAAVKNIVARLSLVMGWPLLGTGNSFLAEAVEKFKKGETVNFPENEIRTPIDVVTAGKALIELAGTPTRGIIHLAGNTAINRYSMAKQIVAATGFSQNLILGTNSNAIPGRAPRANNASLNNELAKQVLKTPMLSLEEGLALTINFKKGLKYEQH
jgi:dTDP-4-dehydrorhamnose reductase